MTRFLATRGLLRASCVAALLAASHSSRAAEAFNAETGRAPALLAPERSPFIGGAEPSPLLEVVWGARVAAVAWLAQEEGADFPFGKMASAAAGSEEAPAPHRTPRESSPVAGPPLAAPRSQSPPPEPLAAAIEEALVRLVLHDEPVNPLGAGDWRSARAAIGAFYADRTFEPVWANANGLTDAGRAILRQLGRAEEDGLDLKPTSLPREVKPPLSPADAASAEVAIATAVVVYAEQASGSRVAPPRISPLIAAAANVADPGAALASVAAARDPAARLADFNPPQKGYRALRDELKRLTERADASDSASAGFDDGLLATDAYPSADLEEPPRRQAKIHRRRIAHAASANSARLSFIARRRAAILANMEMWRWEPREMGERRIEVNVPDFSASLIDGDTVVHQARVVVGKPNTPTPIFSNVMRYVLINPSWQVPDSIIRKEMLPRVAADPEYFVRHGYQVRMVGGRLTVRQPPGEDNALGRLAFMFPNDYSVYMHDTPSQQLFEAEARAFSHGCIRVEDPVRLAELVLNWPESRIAAAFGARERTVFLPHPLPIHIEYFTEFVDAFGELQERADVYGLARRVADTLSKTRQD